MTPPALGGRIRIGILGCAEIARRSMIPAILSLRDRFDLVAVASRDRAKAEAFAARFDCKAVVGYESLLRPELVDAVYVPLPAGLHPRWVGQALEAGLHVYAEKSLALRFEQAQEMVSEATRRGLVLMEGFMFQYHRQQALVRHLLSTDAIGPLRHFHGTFGFPPLPAGNFRYDAHLGGGALFDAGAYPVRAACFLLGDELEVRGAALHDDATLGPAAFGSGFLARPDGVGASVAFGFHNSYQCRYEIWGALGRIVVDRAYTPKPDQRTFVQVEGASGVRTLEVGPDDHFVRALEHFHLSIGAPGLRHELYGEILVQSRALEAMRVLGGR